MLNQHVETELMKVLNILCSTTMSDKQKRDALFALPANTIKKNVQCLIEVGRVKDHVVQHEIIQHFLKCYPEVTMQELFDKYFHNNCNIPGHALSIFSWNKPLVDTFTRRGENMQEVRKAKRERCGISAGRAYDYINTLTAIDLDKDQDKDQDVILMRGDFNVSLKEMLKTFNEKPTLCELVLKELDNNADEFPVNVRLSRFRKMRDQIQQKRSNAQVLAKEKAHKWIDKMAKEIVERNDKNDNTHKQIDEMADYIVGRKVKEGAEVMRERQFKKFSKK